MKLIARSVGVFSLAVGLCLSVGAAPSGKRSSTPPKLNAAAPKVKLTILPPDIVLYGARGREQLVVMGQFPDGTQRDLTRDCKFGVKNGGEKVVKAGADGVLRAAGNGKAVVWVGYPKDKPKFFATTPVEVKNFEDTSISFPNHIEAILSKAGCNQGACHGAQYGKGGFKLSLFGYDAEFDYNVLTKEAQSRRVNKADPFYSLFLRKATMNIKHGGGKRFEVTSEEAKLLAEWVAAGMPFGKSKEGGTYKEPTLERIEVFPKQAIMRPGEWQQLTVRAYFDDGHVEDATPQVRYNSNDDTVATVTSSGLVRAEGEGETAIMLRYLGEVEVALITVPIQKPFKPDYTVPESNYIDKLVFAKLKKLNIVPSPLADDATFLRRVYLDAIGVLPSPDEVRRFLESKDPDKRKKLIDELLERPEFADLWAYRFSDILRVNRTFLSDKGMYAYYRWIRDSFRSNKPMDEFARELITASGSTFTVGPANYYRVAQNPTDLGEATAQALLGIRIQCSRCHNHPFERWKLNDYYGWAAFFARVGRKGTDVREDSFVFSALGGEVNHIKTGQPMRPTPLLGKPIESDDRDRREMLAEWLTSPQGGGFMYAQNIVNRVWAHFFGKGIIDPPDDVRQTNPPSNKELLETLTKDFIEHKFDFRHIVRTMLNSSTYQLSSVPNPSNVRDERLFSRYYVKRLMAETLLDAICIATGVPEKFGGLPLQEVSRAIQLPDTRVGSYFLDVFGRPKREIVCECERSMEANMAQALHLINSGNIQGKITNDNGRVKQLLRSNPPKPDAEMINELYLATLSRYPMDEEMKKAQQHIAQSTSKQEALEDLMWALLNSREFMFNH